MKTLGFLQLESVKYPGQCIDTLMGSKTIGLYSCYDDKEHPPFTQNFLYTIDHEIRGDEFFWKCWDAYAIKQGQNITLNIGECSLLGGNQHFTYDPVSDSHRLLIA